MKKTLVLLVGMLFATICGTATSQQYYNISPKYIYEHQTMDSTHVGVISVDTLLFNKTAATKDVNLYRSSANRLRTSDSLTVDGNLTVNASSMYGRLGQRLETNTSANYGGMAINTWSSSNEGVLLDLQTSRSATIGTQSILASGDLVGAISFRGSDGTVFRDAGIIKAFVDATPGANELPGRLAFFTCTDGASSADEKARLTNAGQFQFSNGTAALPSIAGINDPNTGMRFPGVDTLAFSTGGSERMRIDPSGNVGIGTTGPVEKLAVKTTTTTSGESIASFFNDINTTGHQNNILIGRSATSNNCGVLGYTYNSSPNNEYMWMALYGKPAGLIINGNGSVGIATTTPSTAGKLSVAGGVTIGVATTDTVLNAHQLRINNGGTYSEIDAGETAFANTSDENMKENITPINTDSIYALVRKMNYPRKWQYKASIIRTQSEIDRINEATSDKVVSPLVTARIDSLIKAKATGTFTVNTTQVPVVSYEKAIKSIEPSYVRVGLAEEDKAVVVPADTLYADVPETTYVARYDTVYTCSASKRAEIQNSVLASQQVKATSELATYEARIAKDAARPHVSVMAQDMYPVSRLMKGAAAKETTLSGDDLINALLIAVKKQDERITQLEKRVSELETR